MNKVISTNIEWLPHVNPSWEIGRVKDLFYISKELSTKKNPTVLSLARSAVKIRDISSNEGQLAASYDNYNSVKIGDLLLNPMDLYSGANCNVSFVEGVISPAYSNLRAKVKLEPRFYDFYFKVQYWTMAMFAHGKGVSFDNRWTLNNEALLNYEIPIPSLEEQQRIVETLDRKISQIDKLIANQEKQIEKLNEYKQSIITKAVTKGITNPNCLKYSDLSWFGNIPEHWIITQTKYLFDIIAGATPDSGISDNWDGDIAWVTPADFNTENVYVKKGRRNISKKGFDSCSTSLIPKNSIIFSKRAPVGLVAINLEEICTNQGCLSCIKKVDLNIKYFYYQMSVLPKYFELYASGTTFKEISAQKFGSFCLLVPPIDEQNQIVNFLDSKNNTLKTLIQIKKEKIEKLQEYKKSLIYEYVTGKKQVV